MTHTENSRGDRQIWHFLWPGILNKNDCARKYFLSIDAVIYFSNLLKTVHPPSVNSTRIYSKLQTCLQNQRKCNNFFQINFTRSSQLTVSYYGLERTSINFRKAFSVHLLKKEAINKIVAKQIKCSLCGHMTAGAKGTFYDDFLSDKRLIYSVRKAELSATCSPLLFDLCKCTKSEISQF